VGAHAIVWAHAVPHGNRLRIEVVLVRSPGRRSFDAFETPRGDIAVVAHAVALRAAYLLDRSEAPVPPTGHPRVAKGLRPARLELAAGPAAAIGATQGYAAPGLGLRGALSVARALNLAARFAWFGSDERAGLDVGRMAGAVGLRPDLRTGSWTLGPWLGWGVTRLKVGFADGRSTDYVHGLGWGLDVSLAVWRAWNLAISVWDMYLPDSRLYRVRGEDAYRFPNHTFSVALEMGWWLR
jgi:hypothetical protein